MNKAVIIVAGGIGERSGQKIPKQFIDIHQKPIIIHSIEKFYKYDSNILITVVCHSDYIAHCQTIIQTHVSNYSIDIVAGGNTRFHSVKNGLIHLHQLNFNGIVAVHDAARPCVSSYLIKKCFDAAMEKNICIPAIPLNESIRKVSDNGSNTYVSRKDYRIIQTPQCANFSLLYNAFQQDYIELFTDEANVLEHYGEKIYLIEGEQNNLKITYPIDFKIAEILLKELNN